MELNYLRTFIEVARCNSFTKAAEQLGYAQSSVTQQIQKLELEYNASLFERYGRHMKLTSAGEQLFDRFVEILALYDSSKELVSGQMKGSLVIGTIESMIAYFLPLSSRSSGAPIRTSPFKFGRLSKNASSRRFDTATWISDCSSASR